MGPTRGSRLLLVVADDLGYDPAIDRGILEAHERGIVTAASAMVDTTCAAVSIARAPDTLELGLHLVLPAGVGAAVAEAELARQAARFESLRGRAPSHVDGHKHVHVEAAVLAVVVRWAAARGIRVRAPNPAVREQVRAAGAIATDAFLGDAGLRPCWTTERLLSALAGLPDGACELMCHPGHTPVVARTSFGVEREVELEALCDPRARAILEGGLVALAGRL